MEALLAANPAAIRERDVEGRLPIHCAVAAGRPASEALSALLAAYPAGAQATDGAGRTPLELAVICIASASTVALLLKH
jgi:ankyrin repeat protein